MSNELIPTGGGWDDNESDDRVIQGVLIKCVDGVWTRYGETGPLPPELQLLAISTLTMLQHWQGQKPIETIVKKPGEDLPDVDALNAEIPEDQWELDLNGEPRPPWQVQRVCYLLDADTMAKFTFASSTFGAKVAVTNLKDAVKLRQWLTGSGDLPIVKLSNAPMKTKFGKKLRPDFKIVAWRSFGGGPTQVEGGGAPQIKDASAKPTAARSTEELLNDEIPF